MGQAPEELAGRGAELSNEDLCRKIQVIHQALAVNRPNPLDPVDILCKVGGLDLAALCGVCLGGAPYRVPVLLDGVITNTAALCAVRLCPGAWDALIASHVSMEPAAGLPLVPLLLSGGTIWLLRMIHSVLGFLLEVLWGWQALALRDLRKESRNVWRKLTGDTLENARLAGPAWYFGEYYDKPTIGNALRLAEPGDILLANRMQYCGRFLSLLLICGIRALVCLVFL